MGMAGHNQTFQNLNISSRVEKGIKQGKKKSLFQNHDYN